MGSVFITTETSLLVIPLLFEISAFVLEVIVDRFSYLANRGSKLDRFPLIGS